MLAYVARQPNPKAIELGKRFARLSVSIRELGRKTQMDHAKLQRWFSGENSPRNSNELDAVESAISEYERTLFPELSVNVERGKTLPVIVFSSETGSRMSTGSGPMMEQLPDWGSVNRREMVYITDRLMGPLLVNGDRAIIEEGLPITPGRMVAVNHEGGIPVRWVDSIEGNTLYLSDEQRSHSIAVPRSSYRGAVVGRKRYYGNDESDLSDWPTGKYRQEPVK